MRYYASSVTCVTRHVSPCVTARPGVTVVRATVPAGQAGVGPIQCPDDYLLLSADRLCGDRLNDGSVNSQLTQNADVTGGYTYIHTLYVYNGIQHALLTAWANITGNDDNIKLHYQLEYAFRSGIWNAQCEFQSCITISEMQSVLLGGRPSIEASNLVHI